MNTARPQLQHPQRRTVPAGSSGIDVDGVRPARRTAGREVEPALFPVLVRVLPLVLVAYMIPVPVLGLFPVLVLLLALVLFPVLVLVAVLFLVGVVRRHGPSLPGPSSDTAVSTASVTSPSAG
ncbi:hypothetical protein GCM10027028_23950 [Streptomyces sundarbansensis]